MAMEEKGKGKGYYWWSSVRRKFDADSPFFSSGNLHRELLAKQMALDLTHDDDDDDDDYNNNKQIHDIQIHDFREVFCPIVGCGARLKSLDTFEEHYNARHTASCSTCSRVYPTSRLLSIHISESHDSFFQAKVARGFPMYECLVESCGMKLKSYKSRQQHLVDKHNFPTSFEFLKKSQPSKKYRQKKQRKVPHNSKKEASSSMQVDEETLDGLVSGVSKLSTSESSPSSVSFGRRHNRGLTFVPRAVQRVKRPE